jgi:hypothetical protein
MLLSAAEKDSGVLPGPFPRRVRVDPYAFNRNRRNQHWRNFQLGDIAPVDITGSINLDTGSFGSSSSGFPAQDYSPWLQPVDITPQVQNPYGFASSSTTYADFLQPVAITPQVQDPYAGFLTPTAPDIQPPSFTISDQPSGAPVAASATPPSQQAPGTSGSTDYFGDFLKLASVAGQTFVGYSAAQHGYVPGATGGIMPGVPISGVGGSLTPAQYAMLTPTQRAQYAAMYPGTTPGSSPDLLSQLFGASGAGGSSMMTILLLGGAALSLVLILKK